jgi:hypothetical protein
MHIRSPKTIAKIDNGISARTPFVATSSLKGVSYAVDHGWLQYFPEALQTYREQTRSAESVFVVVSFFTPIAWYTPEHGWTVPRAKYSQTTSRHQSRVESAIRDSAAKVTYI